MEGKARLSCSEAQGLWCGFAVSLPSRYGFFAQDFGVILWTVVKFSRLDF